MGKKLSIKLNSSGVIMMRLSEHVRLMGNRHFRIYLAGAERNVLIEAGVSAVVPTVQRQLGELGQPVEVDTIVVMHAHFDHICGLPGLKLLLPGAAAAGSAQAAGTLGKQKVLANFFKEDLAMTGMLREEGLVEETALGNGAAGSGNNGSAAVMGGIPVAPPEEIKLDLILGDGYRYDLGAGTELIFFRAPGHSPCSMAAYCPADEVLFVSDSTGFQIDSGGVFPIFFDGYDPYVETIKKMAEMPVRVVAVAHEDIITGRENVKKYFRMSLDCAEKARDTIEGLLKAGKTREEVADELFRIYYRGLLKIYSEQNIRLCTGILTRRVGEITAL